MISEFFLSPDLFDGDDDTLRERIRVITSVLLPVNSTPPIVVCRLGGEAWQNAILHYTRSISNTLIRKDILDLLAMIGEKCVVRDIDSTPRSPEQWIDCASKVNSGFPIDCIVSGKASGSNGRVTAFEQFRSSDFWESFSNPRDLRRDTESQEPALKGLCRHTEWMVLKFPFIRGGDDDEIVTIKQIFQLLGKRPKPKRTIEVDIYLSPREHKAPNKLLKSVKYEIQQDIKIPQFVSATLVLLDKKAADPEREIVAGEFRETGTNHFVRSPRWWIRMGHVATKRNNVETTAWSLFPQQKSAHRMDQLNELPRDRIVQIQ